MRGRVLDIGGRKIGKRGIFSPPLDRVDLWEYLNTDPLTKPDYCCNAEKIPLPDFSVDTVIMTELLEKVGVEFETVKSGELKDVGSYSRKVTDADREHLNEMVDDMYDQFVTAVSDNRPITKEKVITLADGRVYTGLKSKDLGLIDLIGTFEDAIKMAGSMGQISGIPKTIQINKKRPQILDWLSGSLETKVSDWFGELPAYRWRME